MSLDSEELSEWIAYDRIEPLPDSYWQSAMIASTVANSMGVSRGRRLKLDDFLPAVHTPAREKSVEQQAEEAWRVFKGIADAHNAKCK